MIHNWDRMDGTGFDQAELDRIDETGFGEAELAQD
jgi:hypothetical protein